MNESQIKKIKNIAKKIYHNNPHSVEMLISDLEDFFEISSVKYIPDDEFDRYIEKNLNRRGDE